MNAVPHLGCPSAVRMQPPKILAASACSDLQRASSGHYEVREDRLNLVDVDLLGELLLDRNRVARNPDFQFGVQIESTGSFDSEVCDRAVGHAVVFDFLAGQTLFVDHQ